MIRLPKFGLYIVHDLFLAKIGTCGCERKVKPKKLNDVRIDDSNLLLILSVFSNGLDCIN